MIVEVALRLAERDGIESLSMRRVANELNASPMALYRHVTNKKALLELLVEEVVGELEPPVVEESPRARILAVLEQARRVFAEHEWLLGVLLAQDPPPASHPWLTEYLLAALAEAGLDDHTAVCAYRSLWQYTTGHLLNARHDDTWRERVHDGAEAELEDDRYPVLRRMLPEMAGLDRAHQFRMGLAAQLDGFLATVEKY